jgi:hypothetical protein
MLALAGCGAHRPVVDPRMSQHPERYEADLAECQQLAKQAPGAGGGAAGGALVGAIGARAALALSGAVPLAIGALALLCIRSRRTTAAEPLTRRPLHAHHHG